MNDINVMRLLFLKQVTNSVLLSKVSKVPVAKNEFVELMEQQFYKKKEFFYWAVIFLSKKTTLQDKFNKSDPNHFLSTTASHFSLLIFWAQIQQSWNT